MSRRVVVFFQITMLIVLGSALLVEENMISRVFDLVAVVVTALGLGVDFGVYTIRRAMTVSLHERHTALFDRMMLSVAQHEDGPRA